MDKQQSQQEQRALASSSLRLPTKIYLPGGKPKTRRRRRPALWRVVAIILTAGVLLWMFPPSSGFGPVQPSPSNEPEYPTPPTPPAPPAAPEPPSPPSPPQPPSPPKPPTPPEPPVHDAAPNPPAEPEPKAPTPPSPPPPVEPPVDLKKEAVKDEDAVEETAEDAGITFSGKYDGENLHWKPCGDVDGRAVECSDLDVPMDQFNETNSGDKTFNLPLIRMRGHNATQNLLFNPGGPGGSGISAMFRLGSKIHTIVGEGFHLVSFDPRGVNSSKPNAACYPDRETAILRGQVHDDNVIADSPELYAWTTNYVQACKENMGEHGKYMNTPQTAADMNSILDALGQEDMVYWGFSYGTLLGQTYATMYPSRSEKVIIDGVVNQFDWYGEPLPSEDLTDTIKVVQGFCEECIKAGSNCSLSMMADDPYRLEAALDLFFENLHSDPMSVYVNASTYGVLSRKNLWLSGVFNSLYKPATWYELAERLYLAMQGNGTEALLAYGSRPVPDRPDDSSTVVWLNDAPSGPDYWTQGRTNLLEHVLPYLDEYPFGEVWMDVLYSKQQWAIPRTHSYVPVRGVTTSRPLLILSTTYDPVCPLVSARSARDAFVGSRIVEVKTYGHCSIAMPSQCMAEHIRGFLYNGTLPEEDAQCEPDGAYFVAPEERQKAVDSFSAMVRGGSGNVKGMEVEEQVDEKERIRMAQRALAADVQWWPRF